MNQILVLTSFQLTVVIIVILMKVTSILGVRFCQKRLALPVTLTQFLILTYLTILSGGIDSLHIIAVSRKELLRGVNATGCAYKPRKTMLQNTLETPKNDTTPNWDRFDFKGVALFSRTPDRTQSVKQEFDRVGLTDVIPFWTGPNPYDKVIEDAVFHSRMCSGAFLAITLKHLQMVRVAYDLGSQHALFFENDIRFLKDLNLLETAITALPADFDVALLDWVPRSKATPEEIRKVTHQSGLWHRFQDLRSCAAYALSRRGMEKYLSVLEAPAKKTGKLKICDQHWWDVLQDGKLKGYCACPNLGVQGVPGGTTGYERMWGQYTKINIKREDYA